jgi:hypothetical protein
MARKFEQAHKACEAKKLEQEGGGERVGKRDRRAELPKKAGKAGAFTQD